MNKKILGAALGLAVLAASTAASAHVDVAIGLGIPGAVYAPAEPVYAPPPPVVYAPAPVAVAYGGDDDWRHERRGPRELLHRIRFFVFFGLAGDMMFFAMLIVLFFFVHILMVVFVGAINEIRSMITGWYRLPPTERE